MHYRRILLTAITVVSTAFSASPEPPVIESVSVPGAGADVKLATQVGQPYDAATVTKDVHYLWALGRYSDVKAELDDRGNLVFRVVPRRPKRLHEVRVEPNSFGLQIKGKQGAPIDDAGAHSVALDAQKQLRARGYLDTRVTYAMIPVGRDEVNLQLHVDLGKAVRVRAVVLEGDPAVDASVLAHQLKAMRAHNLVFWRMLPDYTPDAVDYDVARLRSYYLSQGYYDVRIAADDVNIDGKDAIVPIWIESGPRYSGAPDPKQLCKCMFEERRAAARQGIMDFSPRLHVDLMEGGTANVTTTIDKGRPYVVGRIEFSGNHRTPDLTLRRELVLEEAQPLDEYLLRKSIARLNQSALIDPIDMKRVQIATDPKTGVANIRIPIEERKRGSWNFSGPVGPAGIAGPLEASLGARLPAWGQNIFELSTYALTISAVGLYRPITAALGPPKTLLMPLLALRRPYLPGESWTSGFMIAPQLGWQGMLFGYGMTQLQERALEALAGDRGLVPELDITVETPHGEATMFCDAPKPRMNALRITGSILVRVPSALMGF